MVIILLAAILLRRDSGSQGNKNKLGSSTKREGQSRFIVRRSISPNNNTPNPAESPALVLHANMEPLDDPNASPRQLRKALEWELSLDNRDLRSHAWYHGTIPRQRAEELMVEEGDFLIRDCISQPGDYVLTCRWKEICLHFVINKVVLQPNTVYERIQFQFEDDSYDTVPDLVTFYVGSGKPISVASGARICRPINRSMPLTFYATKYGSQCLAAYGMIGGMTSPPPSSVTDSSPRPSPFQSPRHTPSCSPPTPRREIPPKLPEKLRTPTIEAKRFGIIVDNLSEEFCKPGSQSQSSGDSVATLTASEPSPARKHLVRVGSEPMLSPTLERKKRDSLRLHQCGAMSLSMTQSLDSGDTDSDKPPPKPSRVPSLRNPKRPVQAVPREPSHYYNESVLEEHKYEDPELVQAQGNVCNLDARIVAIKDSPMEYQNGSDSGNGSGDSVHSSDTVGSSEPSEHGTIKKRPSGGMLKKHSLRTVADSQSAFTPRHINTDGDSAAEEEVLLLNMPDLNRPSCFDLTTFYTLMLPNENKPLDGSALNRVKCALLETGSRILANHLTKIDISVLKSSGDRDLGLGVISGIELITLPQGSRLRMDLLERLECMKLFVAMTILASMNETERAELVHKWIQVAIDTKTALGNLYGFNGIMLGLGLPQIHRLKATWNILRKKYTESTLTYETKLRSTLKAMNEGTNPQAPNTCIPHLLPLLALLERPLDGTNANQLPTSAAFLWETSTSDYGIQLIHSHLEAGRAFVAQCTAFRRNAEIILANAKYDDILLDIFSTEFHLRFLWGAKGAMVNTDERHAKFQQVLAVMSERCEAS